MLLGISSRMFDSNEKKRLHYWECFFHSYGAFFLQLALNHTWLIRARVFTLAKLKLSTIKITKTGRQINEPNIYMYMKISERNQWVDGVGPVTLPVASFISHVNFDHMEVIHSLSTTRFFFLWWNIFFFIFFLFLIL